MLRLGRCTFDFDVLDALNRAETEDEAAILAEALVDVFAGSAARELHVVLPPRACHVFFAPVPPGLEAAEQRARLNQEAAALLGPRPDDNRLDLTAHCARTETLKAGSRVEWMHVVAVPERLHTRFERLARDLPFVACQWSVSTQGAARALPRLAGDKPSEELPSEELPCTLALGRYATHIEYVLYRGREWHSHYVHVTVPADGTYFALAFLERLGVEPSEVDRVLVYGPGADPEALAPLLGHAFQGVPVERFDPMPLVDFDPENMTADFDASAYLPCIGILL